MFCSHDLSLLSGAIWLVPIGLFAGCGSLLGWSGPYLFTFHYNLYDQAEKPRSKAPRFEAHSNQQFCPYLLHFGKIRTIQLEYTDAKESLLQAARKAPVVALRFKVHAITGP